MKLKIVDDYDSMSRAAFDIVHKVVADKPNAVLGLATGSSPIGLYRLMVDDCQQNGTTYKDVKTVNLDEYVGLSADDIQSYAYFMRHNLFDGIDVNPDNTNLPNGMADDLDAECHRYDNLLQKLRPDVQVLGLGSNGHIAFNEPHTPFDSTTHVVKLADSTVKDNSRLFDSMDQVPRRALTMGTSNIMNAKKIVMLVSGANKADALKAMIEGECSESCPASILQKHSDVTVICDRQAAEKLSDLTRNKHISVVK